MRGASLHFSGTIMRCYKREHGTRRDAQPEAPPRLVVRATTSAEQANCVPNLRGIGLLPIRSGKMALLHICDVITIFTGNKYNTSRQTPVHARRACESPHYDPHLRGRVPLRLLLKEGWEAVSHAARMRIIIPATLAKPRWPRQILLGLARVEGEAGRSFQSACWPSFIGGRAPAP